MKLQIIQVPDEILLQREDLVQLIGEAVLAKVNRRVQSVTFHPHAGRGGDTMTAKVYLYKDSPCETPHL